uniref:hypothetical protein n=2 Tax=Sphingobacterium TaxID=28453 RepID=UPI00289B9C0F|nr:hypothetical protein [Sphingobacterium multivorum]
MNKDIDRVILAEIFEAYLIKGHSHRQIQQQLLGLPAPPRGGGFKTMEILHTYNIHGSEKAIFKSGIVRGKVNKKVEDLLTEYIDAQKEAERYFEDWRSQNPINPKNKPTTRSSLIQSRYDTPYLLDNFLLN